MPPSLHNQAVTTVAGALAASATVQALLGVSAAADPVVAAAALIFHADAGEALEAPYILVSCKPARADERASGLRVRTYAVSSEVWIAPPDAADPAGDFNAMAQLDAVVDELWAQHHLGTLSFELVDIECDQPVRDEDTSDRHDEMGSRLEITLEAWDDG